MKNDDDDDGPAIYAEYERLLAAPDELEELADRLEIPHDGQLTADDIRGTRVFCARRLAG